MKNLIPLLTGIVAITVSGCRCGPGGTQTNVPDLVATPTAISFNACPTRDESGAPVKDVFADVKKLTLANRGKASAQLTYTITGAGKDAFSFAADGGAPSSIGSLDEFEFPLAFSPTAKGDVRADLTIDDQVDDTNNPVVTLIGTGINLPAQPSIETGPQKTDGSAFLTCTADTPLSDCTLEFPDTMMQQSATLQLKIRNRGCPALKVTALNIDGSSNPGTTDGFTIDSPAVRPSTTSPLVLSTADGTDETIITVRFTATDDGTGASNQSHYAVLTILSNDPQYGDGFANPARITLQANAVKPSIYVTPTSCNYTNPQDACGYGTRVANKAKFTVTNDGSTPLSISAVRFRSSGTSTSSNTRFSVTANIVGQTIQPTTSGVIEVTERDEPLLVSDQLEIVADIPGMGAGSGGTVVVSVISGIKPCLSTDPMDVIDFGDPAEELTAKILTIRNGAGCGTMIINEVSISPQPLFSFIDTLVPPNTMLAAGGSVQATVQYRRPPSGGQQQAELYVKTNDTDYGPPQYKLMVLQSNASFDPIPQAELTACAPASLLNDPDCRLGMSTSAAFNLAMINPDEITLSGVNSTDNVRVAEYRFTLLPPFPGGATSAALANNGMKITTNKTKLTIPPGATGTYRVGLEVWDDRGQQSAANATMTVNIYP